MSRANTNAKEELLRVIGNKSVVALEISYSPCSLWEMYDETPPPSKELKLPVCYTQEDWDNLLSKLDFKYDAGYGGMELQGTVWFADQTWLERKEYDGSEWWCHMSRPDIPPHLLTDLKNECDLNSLENQSYEG
jgi:hypothetical protein